MGALQAKLDQYNQEFLKGLNSIADSFQGDAFTEDYIKRLYDDTTALFKEFPEYKAAVSLGILERDVKSGILDRLLEALENGEVQLCPTDQNTTPLQ